MRADMSIQTTMAPQVGAGSSSVQSESLFSRFYKAIVTGRMLQAERIVSRHLANLSDAQLKDLGFTSDEIVQTRKASKLPVSYWS